MRGCRVSRKKCRLIFPGSGWGCWLACKAEHHCRGAPDVNESRFTRGRRLAGFLGGAATQQVICSRQRLPHSRFTPRIYAAVLKRAQDVELEAVTPHPAWRCCSSFSCRGLPFWLRPRRSRRRNGKHGRESGRRSSATPDASPSFSFGLDRRQRRGIW